MDQATNRLPEISCDSLVGGVNYDVNTCTRPGCTVASDGLASPDLCTEHREDQRRRQRECMARRRDRWDAEGVCTRCGGSARYRQSKWCRMCLDERGLIQKPDVNKDVNNRTPRGFEMRMEQSPDGKPRLRKRFGGQLKRGRRSIGALDSEDLSDAAEALRLGAANLTHSQTNEVKILPRVQRDDIRNQALAKLVEASRWIVEVVKRHGYEIPIEIEEDEED